MMDPLLIGGAVLALLLVARGKPASGTNPDGTVAIIANPDGTVTASRAPGPPSRVGPRVRARRREAAVSDAARAAAADAAASMPPTVFGSLMPRVLSDAERERARLVDYARSANSVYTSYLRARGARKGTLQALAPNSKNNMKRQARKAAARLEVLLAQPPGTVDWLPVARRLAGEIWGQGGRAFFAAEWPAELPRWTADWHSW